MSIVFFVFLTASITGHEVPGGASYINKVFSVAMLLAYSREEAINGTACSTPISSLLSMNSSLSETL